MRVTVELIATCTPAVPMAALMLEEQVRGSLHHAFESPCETSAVARHDIDGTWIITARILAAITEADIARARQLPDAWFEAGNPHQDAAVELATHALMAMPGTTCHMEQAIAVETVE